MKKIVFILGISCIASTIFSDAAPAYAALASTSASCFSIWKAEYRACDTLHPLSCDANGQNCWGPRVGNYDGCTEDANNNLHACLLFVAY